MKYFMVGTAIGDCVYPLQHFMDCYGNGTVLFEMKRDIGGEMFCSEYRDFVDGVCGNICEYYDPCNGISGRCSRLQNGYVETGNKYIIKNGKLEASTGL